MSNNRAKRARGGLLFAVVLSMYCAVTSCAERITNIDFEAAKLDGEGIVARIEEYHRANSTYPASLEVLGERWPASQGLRWRYYLDPHGSYYALLLGDYDKNGFLLYWESRKAAWTIDT